MANKSTYLANAVVTEYLVSPATPFVALYTDAACTTEITGGSYARTAVTFSTDATPGEVVNSVVTFVTATADWGPVDGVAIFDAIAGNQLYFGQLTTQKTVSNGDTVSFAASALKINES